MIYLFKEYFWEWNRLYLGDIIDGNAKNKKHSTKIYQKGELS